MQRKSTPDAALSVSPRESLLEEDLEDEAERSRIACSRSEKRASVCQVKSAAWPDL